MPDNKRKKKDESEEEEEEEEESSEEGSEESGSEDESEESEDDSDDEPISKRRKSVTKKAVAKKKTPTKSKSKEKTAPGMKQRGRKEAIVAEILKRWWYALPDWPPTDFDYSKGLRAKGLRLVKLEDWEDEPAVNSEGLSRVVEVKGYPGMFRGERGQIWDLRPADSCPSFRNLMKKEESSLLGILIKAYEVQIAQLVAQPKYDTAYETRLRKELGVWAANKHKVK